MTLNRNPENFFAQIEQAAFSPGNTVPGIGLSPDKMLLGRAFAYNDAQRNRIGTNFHQLPVRRSPPPAWARVECATGTRSRVLKRHMHRLGLHKVP